MADIKWSAFPSGGTASVASTLVGLQAGANVKLSLSATPSASGVGLWDVNSNFSANNFIRGYASTATNATTTTLTVASKGIQYFTGSTTQTVVMPVTSTLVLGMSWEITNSSSGIVTVNSSGGNLIRAMASNTILTLTCISTSATDASGWATVYRPNVVSGAAFVTSITGTANQVIASSATGDVTLSLPQSIATASTPTFAGLTAGNLNLASNSLTSTNINGNINLLPNGSGITIVGTNTAIAGQSQIFQVALAGTRGIEILGGFSNDINPPTYRTYKSRSTTIGSFTTVQSGDSLGHWSAYGDDGTQFTSAGVMAFNASGSISSGIVPGQWTLQTGNTSGALVTAITVSNAQVVTLANALLPASGGTGTSTAPSAGQIPIGTSGSVYTPAAINSGTGIVVANGSGSITVSATGGGIAWTTLSGTTQAAAVNNGYVSGNAAQTTVTLPATAAIGSVVAVEGLGAAGWKLTANTGQTIKIGSSTTTSAGSLTSVAASDNIYVTCIVADTTWRVRTTNSAGLTIS